MIYNDALEAARRGRSGTTSSSVANDEGYDIVYLREEAPLLALVGDTAAALQAYELYLALREEANGPWLLQLDSVRVEYAKLAGSDVLP